MKWIDGKLYPLRKIGVYPQIYIERSVMGKYRTIKISLLENRGVDVIIVELKIKYARLFLKRISQCFNGNL